MYNNKKLKESLQSLSKSVYQLFDEELHLEDGYQNDPLHISIALYKLESRIREIREFNICVELMAQDEQIKAIQGKLVGTYSGASSVRDEETCLLSFIKQIYFESKNYDQDIFDKKYFAFEELFYSDHLAFKDTVNLYNFSFDNTEIMLGHGLIIREAVEPVNEQQDYTAIMYRPHALFSASSFVIERNYKRKKIIGESTEKDEAKINWELSETGNLFDLVINSLRLLKSSAVYRDNQIKTENITFHPLGGTIIRFPAFENTVVGEKCNIELTDISLLCSVFDFLYNEKDNRFKVALRRLSLGMERKNPEDKLLDYMIGLETLYMPDGNAELSFRLSVRVAFLLSMLKDRKETFEFLRKMYTVRSNIVHGSEYDLKADDVKKLEGLLRESIILWIKNKNSFSASELNKILFES
ncbi:MAG: hypothetical protein EHM20_10500 [Alphaproteobacteria bacterium]|nr:MAG: hypothetical protein EHM20_10500 [Alphaproteobacteria bacterium]